MEKLIWTPSGGLPNPINGDAATGLKVARPDKHYNQFEIFLESNFKVVT